MFFRGGQLKGEMCDFSWKITAVTLQNRDDWFFAESVFVDIIYIYKTFVYFNLITKLNILQYSTKYLGEEGTRPLYP